MTERVEQARTNNSVVTGTSRLSQWFALAFFDSIALIALTTRYNDFESERAIVKWSLSVLCIALGMAGLAIMASFVFILGQARFALAENVQADHLQKFVSSASSL